MTPYLYEIEIKPYIGIEFNERSFTFDGKTNIHFNCVRPTDKIIFHINDLRIKNLVLKNTNGDAQAQSIKFDKMKHFVIVEVKKKCLAGQNYSIEIDYEGKISDNLSGFYKSSYLDENFKLS